MKQTTETFPIMQSIVDGNRAKEILTSPANTDTAAATLLTKLSNGDMTDTAEAFATLAEYNKALLDGDAQAIRYTLIRQMCVLEAIFTHVVNKAAISKLPEHKATLFRTAISAQQAGVRTLAMLGNIGVRDVQKI